METETANKLAVWMLGVIIAFVFGGLLLGAWGFVQVIEWITSK